MNKTVKQTQIGLALQEIREANLQKLFKTKGYIYEKSPVNTGLS